MNYCDRNLMNEVLDSLGFDIRQYEEIARVHFFIILIDWDRIQPNLDGRTNRERAADGEAPYWSDGTKVELHHLPGEEPGPMVEIPAGMHNEYYTPLHGLIED